MKFKNKAIELIEAVKNCTSSYTAVNYIIEKLKNNNFLELKITELNNISLANNQGYYIKSGYSQIIAFKTGIEGISEGNLRISASHIDHPALSIKPSPEIFQREYGKLNVETYGGLILNTWLDRPLSISGMVALKSNEVFKPEVKIIDIKKDVLTIPNLSIHQNREVNKGVELNRQSDMEPLALIKEELTDKDFFIKFLANHLDREVSDILDYELYIYNNEEGRVIGFFEDFIQAPRLDNITSVLASLNAIISSKRKTGMNMAVFYDNEEIGSKTLAGADSVLLSEIIKKIYKKDTFDGFFLSVDTAHAYHPNKPEKSDPTNINILNKGFVIKRAASKTYATDPFSIGIIEQIAIKEGIPYQKFASRSDVTTGSTLSTIANKYLSMNAADIGVPILAMHSSMETMGIKDQYYLEKIIEAFYVN